VTLAASGSHEAGPFHPAARPVPESVQDSWFTMLLIAYGIVIVGVIAAMIKWRDRWATPKSTWIRNFCIVLLLMTLIAGAGAWAVANGHLRRPTLRLFAQQAQQRQGKGAGSTAVRPVPARPADFQWPFLIAVGGLILLGGVWIAIRRSRPAAQVPDEDSVEEELARAIGSTIDDLRRERDARRAVIAAYANMERILAAHGLARQRAEVPYEYLTRVLQLLNVRESSARELTGLFEFAKFSDHAVDATMKERAIESLVLVQEDLQAPQEFAA
jgi:hypothetical protein